jgi:hypothetical protein
MVAILSSPVGGDASGNLVLPQTPGTGLKMGTSPVFGWVDLTGEITLRGTGASDPTFAVYYGGIRKYQFGVGKEVQHDYHWQHDYVPASTAYIHAHWSHAATTVTGGSVTWGMEFIWAKGFNQMAFTAPKTITVTQNASTTQRQHMIAEVEFTSNGGDATHLDYNLLEIDGLLHVRTFLSANDMTVSGGAVPDPFLHYVDIHYQSTGRSSINRNYPFYTV